MLSCGRIRDVDSSIVTTEEILHSHVQPRKERIRLCWQIVKLVIFQFKNHFSALHKLSVLILTKLAVLNKQLSFIFIVLRQKL